MFSKSCEYGIKAILYIAQTSQRGERVALKEIASATNSPTAFTAKILQTLVKAGLINSTKGPHGGFQIEKTSLPLISVKQVVIALDGDGLFEGCALGLERCSSEQPCPMHNQFEIVRNQLDETLSSFKLLNIANDLNEGLAVLKR